MPRRAPPIRVLYLTIRTRRSAARSARSCAHKNTGSSSLLTRPRAKATRGHSLMGTISFQKDSLYPILPRMKLVKQRRIDWFADNMDDGIVQIGENILKLKK
ncbi:hypothetical protein Tco_0067121 [Tanacetum coccineum]